MQLSTDDCESLLKGCFQLATSRFVTEVGSDLDEDYVLDIFPAKLANAVNAVVTNPTPLNKLAFVWAWYNYAKMNNNKYIRALTFKPTALKMENPTSAMAQFETAMSYQQLIGFISVLANGDGGVHKYYPQISALLVGLRDFLISIPKCNRESMFVGHFTSVGTEQTIIPVFSRTHAAYLVVRFVGNDRYALAMCNGGEGMQHFVQLVTENEIVLPTQKSFKRYVHFVLVTSTAAAEKILSKIGKMLFTCRIFKCLGKYMHGLVSKGKARLLKGIDLFHGVVDKFEGQGPYILLQQNGNCAVHNLLLALRFCANLYNTDIGRAAVEYSFFSYTIYNTCLQTLEASKHLLCKNEQKQKSYREICSQMVTMMEGKMEYVTGIPSADISHLDPLRNWTLVPGSPGTKRYATTNGRGLVSMQVQPTGSPRPPNKESLSLRLLILEERLNFLRSRFDMYKSAPENSEIDKNVVLNAQNNLDSLNEAYVLLHANKLRAGPKVWVTPNVPWDTLETLDSELAVAEMRLNNFMKLCNQQFWPN